MKMSLLSKIAGLALQHNAQAQMQSGAGVMIAPPCGAMLTVNRAISNLSYSIHTVDLPICSGMLSALFHKRCTRP